MPVTEESRYVATGLRSMALCPSFFPRWNFLILAVAQLVNHLTLPIISDFKPKVILTGTAANARLILCGSTRETSLSMAYAETARCSSDIRSRLYPPIRPPTSDGSTIL